MVEEKLAMTTLRRLSVIVVPVQQNMSARYMKSDRAWIKGLAKETISVKRWEIHKKQKTFGKISLNLS